MKFIRKLERTAKKIHFCDWCDERINPGSQYLSMTIRGRRSLKTWKSHHHCNELVKRFSENSEISKEEFSRLVERR